MSRKRLSRGYAVVVEHELPSRKFGFEHIVEDAKISADRSVVEGYLRITTEI